MAEVERTRNEVIYKREITTDEPNAHAEFIDFESGRTAGGNTGHFKKEIQRTGRNGGKRSERKNQLDHIKSSWQQVTSLQVLSHSVQIQWKKEHHTAQQLKCAPVLLPGLNRRIF